MSDNKQKKKEENSFLHSPLNHLSKPYRVQSAVVLSSKDTPVEQMYVLAHRLDTHWGIEGYEAAKKYEDPVEQVKQREYAKQKKGFKSLNNSKGEKNKNYVTKRGSYLEDLKKISDQVPGPNKYETITQWKEAKPKIQKPQSAPPKRMTFIDQISKEAKLRPIPGTGKYNLEKPLKEQIDDLQKLKNKKTSTSERPNFLCEYEHIGAVFPGPGNYNPRPVTAKLQVNNTKPKDIIAKHAAQEKKRGKSAYPDVGTYKGYPVKYETFGRMLELKKENKEQQKKNYFGLEDRFRDPNKEKKKLQIPLGVNPGPGSYQLIAQWPGKESTNKEKSKVKNWMESMTKGTQKSIYY